MEIDVAVPLGFESGVGPHYGPWFSTGAGPPQSGGGVTLRDQGLGFPLECLFAGKSSLEASKGESVGWSADLFLDPPKMGSLWSRQPVATYSTLGVSKSTVHENRTLLCRLKDRELLLNLFETIGEEAMASALRELYPLVLAEDRSGWEDDREEEEVIFDTFLKHTPPELQESFRDLYHRLHGGPYAYPVIDASDDHGDDADTATEVRVGEVTAGVLDYHFDFDYFKFRVEQGQRYQIGVDHESLRSSSVRLYGSDGKTHERWVDIWTDEGDVSYRQNMRLTGTGRVSYGSQMRWIAPSSGDYYLAVHNFGGKSGRYTLEIAPITTNPDDHGDSKATATAILVGEVVDGIVDYDFDLDFFRLQAVAGQEYRVRIETETRPFLVHVRLYASDGITPTDELAIHYRSGSGAGGGSYHWVAPNSGDYYFAAGGGFGLRGAYRLIIAESDSPWVDLTP